MRDGHPASTTAAVAPPQTSVAKRAVQTPGRALLGRWWLALVAVSIVSIVGIAWLRA